MKCLFKLLISYKQRTHGAITIELQVQQDFYALLMLLLAVIMIAVIRKTLLSTTLLVEVLSIQFHLL